MYYQVVWDGTITTAKWETMHVFTQLLKIQKITHWVILS